MIFYELSEIYNYIYLCNVFGKRVFYIILYVNYCILLLFQVYMFMIYNNLLFIIKVLLSYYYKLDIYIYSFILYRSRCVITFNSCTCLIHPMCQFAAAD